MTESTRFIRAATLLAALVLSTLYPSKLLVAVEDTSSFNDIAHHPQRTLERLNQR